MGLLMGTRPVAADNTRVCKCVTRASFAVSSAVSSAGPRAGAAAAADRQQVGTI